MFRSLVLGLIDLYRKGISPWTLPSCRYVPSCSRYAHEAVDRHGVLRGAWLFLKRFARCNPLGGHGWDPVPPPGQGWPSAESASDRIPTPDPPAGARHGS